ncbi:MAG: hypothetical protein J0H74_03890 [Chitinophagaceae bacterium]|nr:hypothetical protein [Chitinophagaceae bacterium]
MLHSYNPENEKLTQFAVLLDRAAKGEANYATVVNDIIHETHQFATGEKTLYDISRDHTNIILLLSDADKDYFEHLADDPNKYGPQTYKRVLSLIKPSQTPTV